MSHLEGSELGFLKSRSLREGEEERAREGGQRPRSSDEASDVRSDWNCYSLLSVLEELGGGNIESDGDLSGVTSLLDSGNEEVEGLSGSRDVGGESSLISDVGG